MKKSIIWLLIIFGLVSSFGTTFAAQDIMDVMFQPSIDQQKMIYLWTDKQAIWNEVFRSSTQIGWTFGWDCVVGGTLVDGSSVVAGKIVKWGITGGVHTTQSEIQKKITNVWYNWDTTKYCTDILGGVIWNLDITTQQQAPLLVRITKFLLRMTIVLSITMILYNGVLWIVESSSGNDVKDAKNNLIYIFVGVLLALSSVALINLVSSLGMSSLDPNSVVNKDTVDCSMLQTKEDLWISNSCWFMALKGQVCIDLQASHDLYTENNCVSTLSCDQLRVKENQWNNDRCGVVTLDQKCTSLIPYHTIYGNLKCN